MYVRALRDSQAEMQLKECENKTNGEYILYKDLDNKIDAIKQLIEDVKSGKIDKVITKHINRLSRQTEEVVEILDILKKHNVELHALNLNEDNILETELALALGSDFKKIMEHEEQCN
nr:recombinase family protein [Clostridium botulinum]